MDRIFAKIRPQILLIIVGLVAITALVMSDDLSSEVKGTIIGGIVGGMIAIGKDLVQLDKEKNE
jgi:hypothetical protein